MKKDIYGLTGNMGTGKSMVARLLKRYEGVEIINLDKMSKRILMDKNNGKIIKEILGIGNEKINKRKVAKIIFSDKNRKDRLEKFIHPKVKEEMEKKIKESFKKIIIVESAIIFESGWDKYFKEIIIVKCSLKKQFERIKKERKMTDEEIKMRLKSQEISRIKERKSRWIIDNGGSFGNLKDKVKKLYEDLEDEYLSKICSKTGSGT